ncbi:MAG: 16S rRNA (cytidine(1402)-2'-O)-methyltransferase [Flavobacteriaceae bacterium]
MGKLFLVPTPIGNLKDITFRAVEVLLHVDLILAEDTRTSSKLLKHYNISVSLQSHHMHNEHSMLSSIISKLKQGKNIALISDAGTPAISDPGFLLVREAIANNIDTECLPGATAFIPALLQSGLPNDRFIFEGFLPPKKGRQSRLKQLAEENRTIIIYESPHKVLKTVTQLVDFFGGDRKLSFSRELTKLHEETFRGTILEVKEYLEKKPPKGEFVLCIAGKPKK